MCCLRPGLPGVSETIHRDEHRGTIPGAQPRFWFRNGGSEEVYLGSADLMMRNLDRRVEILFPILDARLVRHLRDEILDTCLADNAKARTMMTDGSYVRAVPVRKPGACGRAGGVHPAPPGRHAERVETWSSTFIRHGEAGKKDEWDGERQRATAQPGRHCPDETGGVGNRRAWTSGSSRSSPARWCGRGRPPTSSRASSTCRDRLVIDDRLAPGFGRGGAGGGPEEARRPEIAPPVRHDPGFSGTIAACIGGGRVECKKGGFARVDIDDPATFRGTLAWLMPPRVLVP